VRVAPAGAVRLLVGAFGELVDDVPGIAVGVQDVPVDGVLGALLRRHVAQMLVDPVRAEPAGDPLVPPRLGAHVFEPGLGGVPVVPDVMVIEDHKRRHGGQQPTDHVVVGPGQVVEPGVLLVVGDLQAGRLAGVAAGLHELPHLRPGLIRVHLVADHQQQVGPLMPTREPARVRPQHVGPVDLLLTGGDPARPEGDPMALAGRGHPDATGR
jgi:hypothetical protein